MATSPLSSPSDEMPSQAPSFLESNQSAHRFLYTVFHKKGEILPIQTIAHQFNDPDILIWANKNIPSVIHFNLRFISVIQIMF